MDEFFLRALLAGIGVALATGPLGCFVIWRRMAYFGEALSHSALLGITLGVWSGITLNGAVLFTCLTMAGLITWLQSHTRLSNDAAMGILSHTTLALGMITVTFMEGLTIDLMGYLFGDVLASSWQDVAWIYGGGACILTLLAFLWKPLLNLTVHEGLAQVDGIATELVRFLFMLLIALTVATAFKIVGALLITALLIIPAAAIRPLARTPLIMVAGATVIGVLSVILGLMASFQWDLPGGPAIVLAASLFFVSTLGLSRQSRQNHGQ